MKILVVAFIVLAVVVGFAYGDDEEGGDCPLENELFVNMALTLKVVKCLVPSTDGKGPDIDFLDRPDALEEAVAFFRNYCSDLAPLKPCLDEVNEVWKRCNNKDVHKDFELFEDLWLTALDVFCADNGDKLVKVYQEVQPNPRHPENHLGLLQFIKDCMSEVNWNFLTGDDLLHVRIFAAYGRLKYLRKCLVNNGKDVFLSTNELSSLIGKLFHKIKCLHPVRKTFVLCSSLNHDGTGDRECPPHYKSVEEKHASGKLIDEGFQCFFSPIDIDDNLLPQEVAQNEIGEYLVNYCKNLTEVKDCLDEVTHFARLCLSNKTRHKVFEIFKEMLDTSLEIACSEDGVLLATIFFGNYDRSTTSAEDWNVLGECRDVSVTKIKHVPEVVTDDASSMSLRMYQEVGAFEECLANDIKEEAFKAMAHNFINDVMNRITCVPPNGEESVPCKSIVDGF